LLDAARAVADGNALRATAGCTSPHDRVVVLRVLAPNVESAMNLLKLVWTSWRDVAWGLKPCAPRVWKT
jgi:urease accessory protein